MALGVTAEIDVTLGVASDGIALGVKLNVERIDQRDGKIVLTPYAFDAEKWVVITSQSGGRLMISPGKPPSLSFRLKQKENALHVLCDILSKE